MSLITSFWIWTTGWSTRLDTCNYMYNPFTSTRSPINSSSVNTKSWFLSLLSWSLTAIASVHGISANQEILETVVGTTQLHNLILENLTVVQIVKKIPVFPEARRIITVLTGAYSQLDEFSALLTSHSFKTYFNIILLSVFRFYKYSLFFILWHVDPLLCGDRET